MESWGEAGLHLQATHLQAGPSRPHSVESPFKSYCMDRIGPHSFEMLLLILLEMCQNVPARPSSVQAGSEVLAAQSDLWFVPQTYWPRNLFLWFLHKPVRWWLQGVSYGSYGTAELRLWLLLNHVAVMASQRLGTRERVGLQKCDADWIPNAARSKIRCDVARCGTISSPNEGSLHLKWVWELAISYRNEVQFFRLRSQYVSIIIKHRHSRSTRRTMMSFNLPKKKTAHGYVQILLHDLLSKKSWEVQVQAAKAANLPSIKLLNTMDRYGQNRWNGSVMLQESLRIRPLEAGAWKGVWCFVVAAAAPPGFMWYQNWDDATNPNM